MRLAIIAGTGVSINQLIRHPQASTINTPYGPAAVAQDADQPDLCLMQRHGAGHSIPPHRINYRANIWALHSLGVDAIIATSAVGSLSSDIATGTILLPDSFIDFTSGRPSTFFDSEGNVVHTDMTYPYCPTLRGAILQAGVSRGIKMAEHGCYVCTNGPRYETAAEVRAFRLLGGDIVGMTGVPEIVLARELRMCYAAIALVTNLGAGLGNGLLSHEDVVQVMQSGGDKITGILQTVLREAVGMHCRHC